MTTTMEVGRHLIATEDLPAGEAKQQQNVRTTTRKKGNKKAEHDNTRNQNMHTY